MGYVLIIILMVILVFSALSGRMQRISSLLAACYMAWIAGTLPTNYSFDTATYQMYYPFPPDTHIFEQGYMHLSYFFYTHGMDYLGFRLIIFFIAYLFFYLVILRVTEKPSAFFLLYGIVIFLNDATQVRNFLMFVMVLLAYAIMNTMTMTRFVIGISLLLIATSFQITGILYIFGILFFILKDSMKTKKRLNNIYFTSIFISTLIVVASSKFSVLSTILIKISSISNRANIDQATSVYSNGSFSRYTLAYVLSYLIAFLLIQWLRNRYGKQLENEKYQGLFYVVMLIGLIGMPFTLMSSGFERILRNSLIAFILLMNSIHVKNIKVTDRYIYFLGYSAVCLLCMYGAGLFNMNDPLYMGYYVKYVLHFVRI